MAQMQLSGAVSNAPETETKPCPRCNASGPPSPCSEDLHRFCYNYGTTVQRQPESLLHAQQVEPTCSLPPSSLSSRASAPSALALPNRLAQEEVEKACSCRSRMEASCLAGQPSAQLLKACSMAWHHFFSTCPCTAACDGRRLQRLL